MSRVGNKPISVPEGIDLIIKDGSIEVSGKKMALTSFRCMKISKHFLRMVCYPSIERMIVLLVDQCMAQLDKL